MAMPRFARLNLCLLILAPAFILLLAGCSGSVGSSPSGGSPPSGPPPALALANFLSGLSAPVGFEVPSDGTKRIFVLEQAGRIRVFQQNGTDSGTFLNISSKVACCGETGLLGLAFHPSFSTNGKFYVNYTTGGPLRSVIAEYEVSPPNSNLANAASERVLLIVDQPFSNHNGGQLAFGPDNALYIALGDGGSGGDPNNNGQNKNTLLGKILRIRVDQPFASGKQYGIPSDNPFFSGGGAPEVWAYGLRNPWRFSFDPPTQRLFAGDVGQNAWEEVNLITRGGNFGWNIMEGNHCYQGTCTPPEGHVPPIFEYPWAGGGTSVIGGFVYRGVVIPALVGTYVFGDLSSGEVWGLKQDASGSWQRTLILNHNLTVSSFGRDADGELYLVDYGNGAILHLVAAP